MKRMLLILACLLALTLPAMAEPMVMADGYTAYLGDSGHLYLQDPLGTTKVLRFPMADIISIGSGNVYATAQDGRLFAIRLDGSQTLVVADVPTEADIAKVAAAPAFELTEGALYVLRADGTKLLVSSSVTAAAANEDRIFFITQTTTGVTTLKAIQRSTVATAITTPLPTMLGMGVADPVSMTATADALAIVGADRSVTVISLIDMSRREYPAVSAMTARAVAIGTELFRYTQNEQGWWLAEADEQLPLLTLVDVNENRTNPYAASSAPTATPTPTPTPTPTLRPTATPRPTPTATPEEAYPQLENGDRGTAVRNMQRRLKALGYPVGKVDGAWGKNTQLAVNLFQCALGWKERSYASSAMQERLYSRNAPQYDPYSPLREGDVGTDVMLMQQALFDLGYLGTDEEEEVDKQYGPITTQAIINFQAAAGPRVLRQTGYADADTLFLLFSEDAPRNPALSQPTDPNYPELILPGTPGNPIAPPVTDPNYPEFIVPSNPPATNTDLVVLITPNR